jgi:Spy/CpxP family protein refolding chaperone
MKKFVFVAVLLLSMTTLTFAQFPGGGTPLSPEESAKRNTERMTTDLKLTPDQVAKVDSLNLVFAKRQTALFEKAQGGDRSQMRDEMQKLNTEREAAYAKVLTKDQLETYKKLQQERRGNRGGGGF